MKNVFLTMNIYYNYYVILNHFLTFYLPFLKKAEPGFSDFSSQINEIVYLFDSWVVSTDFLVLSRNWAYFLA